MDIVRFKSGLGNQMFQYALMLELQERGRSVKGSLGYYRRHPELRPYKLNEVFENVAFEEVSDELFDEIDKRWIEIKLDSKTLENFYSDITNRFFYVEDRNKHFTYDPNVFRTKESVYVGFWQTEKYFENVASKVKKAFTFKITDKKLEKFVMELSDKNVCGVQIRRGDYINHKDFANICTEKYYHNAMDYIKTYHKECKFVFISDDMEWVKENFKSDEYIYCEASIFENYQDWYDMYIMSMCNHCIIANSTFGWWGAYLNNNAGKIVIAPEKWCNYKNDVDIWLDDWIRMEI